MVFSLLIYLHFDYVSLCDYSSCNSIEALCELHSLFFRSTSFSMFIPIFSLKCFVFAHCQHLTRCSHSIRRVNPSEGTMKNEEFVNNA